MPEYFPMLPWTIVQLDSPEKDKKVHSTVYMGYVKDDKPLNSVFPYHLTVGVNQHPKHIHMSGLEYHPYIQDEDINIAPKTYLSIDSEVDRYEISMYIASDTIKEVLISIGNSEVLIEGITSEWNKFVCDCLIEDNDKKEGKGLFRILWNTLPGESSIISFDMITCIGMTLES